MLRFAVPVMALLLASPLLAQPKQLPDTVTMDPFIFGTMHTFRSTVLGEERTLIVKVPEGYEDTTATYPVIYVLDGSANEDYPHIAGLVQFMNMYDLLPKSIVVGIANVDRYRDFTHPSTVAKDLERLPQAGGSAKFIAFLAQEVSPMITAMYRVQGKGTIIGQSLGGLLVTEILFTRPELYDDHIIVSPSLWWDNGSLVSRASDILKSRPDMTERVYLALGEEGKEMAKGMERLVSAFKQHAGPSVKWWYVPFPEESHATILHRAVYKAFELMNPR